LIYFHKGLNVKDFFRITEAKCLSTKNHTTAGLDLIKHYLGVNDHNQFLIPYILKVQQQAT
tara:strand:- start:10 stop:192 length:183 start_codon:yes stop_codon:yes gene_type:complete